MKFFIFSLMIFSILIVFSIILVSSLSPTPEYGCCQAYLDGDSSILEQEICQGYELETDYCNKLVEGVNDQTIEWEKTQSSNNSSNNKSQGIGQELNQIVREKISELKEGNYNVSLGQELNVKQISADLRELRVEGVSAKTNLNITAEEKDNKTIFKAHLSNGKGSEIKIMPDRASETAIARLKLKVCSEENKCTIELKEVGKSNDIKAAYNVKAEKEVKVLGLFKAKMNVEANVNAETGEIISSKVPWWASISTG